MALSCSVNPWEIKLNNEKIFTSKSRNADDFLMAAYRSWNMNYPRFHKMDTFCKLTIIAAQPILNTKNHISEKTALLILSRTGSMHIDTSYYNNVFTGETISYKPTQFTYTLPSAILGELCIKYDIRGENFLFILPDYNFDVAIGYARHLFENCEYKTCVMGWVDYENEAQFRAELIRVEAEEFKNLNILNKISKYGKATTD